MNIPCVPPCVALPLYRPWWQRLLDSWPRPAPRAAEPRDPDSWSRAEWRALQGLDRRTLHDIGAPDWVGGGVDPHEAVTRAMLGR